MATQSLEFGYTTAQTLTAQLFAIGSDTVVATASSVTEATNRDGRYVAAFTDVPAGAYLLVYFLGGVGAGSERYTLTLTTATFQPDSEVVRATLGTPAGASIAADIAAVAANMPTLNGPFTRTLTIVDSDTDEPIESATVRFFRTGETETQVTDADGEVAFTVEAATWSYAIVANGYGGTTGTIVVSATGSTEIQLTATSITLPDNPALATLPIRCLDEAGAPEADVTIYARLVKIPTGSTGISFDGVSQSDTSDVNGDASLTVVKSATYEIRRGSSTVWHTRVMTSADVQVPMSFIGADPA